MTLEQCLAEQIVAPGPIIELTRTPSPYHSSFAIENLKVILGDSKELDIIFKNVGKDGLLREAIQVKPEFIYDPLREIRVYNSILADAGLDTALCYGSVADTARGRYWLFLEMVRGVELYQVGDLSVWERAAAWLARLHRVKVSPEIETALPRASMRSTRDAFPALMASRCETSPPRKSLPHEAWHQQLHLRLGRGCGRSRACTSPRRARLARQSG